MTKIKSITIILLLTLVIVLISNSPVFAATLNKVTYNDSKITIEGSCTTSNQIQVIIFDLNKQPLYFTTVDVKNNTFNKTLDAKFNLEEGKNYTIKVADYSGTGVSEGNFVATVLDPNEKDETPKTGTQEYLNIAEIILGISLIFSILLNKN